MDFEIDFDRSPDFVYIKTSGVASAEGFDELLKGMVASPNWVAGASQLVDHRKLALDQLTSEHMQAIEIIVKKHSEKLGKGRCAFVVNDALGFGFARMYELIGGEELHRQIGVFYSMEDAVEWLRN